MNEHRLNLYRREVVENKEEFRLIWLDTNINDSADSIQNQMMLLELNPATLFYTDFDRCMNLVKSIRRERILFIVSEDLAPLVLPKIQHSPSILAIFIFCPTPQQDLLKTNEYKKSVEIFPDQDSLLKSISAAMNHLKQQTLTTYSFDPNQKTSRDVGKDSAVFMWHQMLLHILKGMPQDEQSKQDMLSKCRDYYRYNKTQLDNIDRFRNEYSAESAIEWYTEDCFLYRSLNQALRTEDIESLYSFRFFIIDLCLDIERESKKLEIGNGLILYRGAVVPVREFEKLRNSDGKIISFNGFLSASRDMNVACSFAPQGISSDDSCSILFEITVDPAVKKIVFADVARRSRMKDEKEVIFSLNSVFKIVSVKLDSNLGLWKVQLQATDKVVQNAEEYLKSIQQGMDYYSPIIYFGRLLLYELGQTAQAEKHFEMLLKSLPSDHSDIASVYNWLGVIYHMRNHLNLALTYYEKAYMIRQSRLPPDHPHIASSLYDFGYIAEGKKDFDRAIRYYEQSLNIDEKHYKGDHEHIAETIKKLGMVYRKTGDLDKAFEFINRALKMFQRILPAQHPHIAMCLRNIGEVHLRQQNFDEALDHFHQKLDMDEQCLPSDHYYLYGDLDLIAETYVKKGEIEKSLEFCRNKLRDQKNVLDKNHPRLARTLITMSKINANQDLKEALKYYEEALLILEHSSQDDHETIAHYFESLCKLYPKRDISDNALERFLEVFDSSRQKLPSDHTNIGNMCRTIALHYREIKNSSKALYYFNESLCIYKANYGLEHKQVKSVEADIMRLQRI